jgi:hypothetical protein
MKSSTAASVKRSASKEKKPRTARRQWKARGFFSRPKATTLSKPAWFSKLVNFSQDTWLLEYLFLAFSIACVVTIYAILFHFNDKALRTWHSKLSVNTVLSIIGTAMKGSTLLATGSALGQSKWTWYYHIGRRLKDFQTFDAASRGPFGALFFLLQLPRAKLASVGALVFLVGLASDASIQASTSQPLRSKSLPTAAIPVCRNYSTGSSDLDPVFKTSLFTGIFNAEAEINAFNEILADNSTFAKYTPLRLNDTTYKTSATCGTGNCSFPSYFSLVVRHQCSDVSHLLQIEDGSNLINQTVSLQFPDYGGTAKLRATYTGTTPVDWKPGDPEIVYTMLNVTSSAAYDTMVTPPDAASGKLFTTDNLLLVDVYGIAYNDSMGVENTTENRFEAFHCDLHFAVQHFNASVSDAVLTETPGAFTSGSWSFKSDFRKRHGNVYDETWYWFLRANLSGTEHEIRIYDGFFWAAAFIVPQYFTGAHTNAEQATNEEIYYTMLNAEGSIGIDRVFANVAQSLTTYFRSATNETATGSTQELEQYIHVRWQWLLVPVSMVALNAAFVIATDLQSRRYGVPSWRTSALASMLSETSAEEGATATLHDGTLFIGPPGRFDRVSDLEEWAGTRSAYLRQKDG